MSLRPFRRAPFLNLPVLVIWFFLVVTGTGILSRVVASPELRLSQDHYGVVENAGVAQVEVIREYDTHTWASVRLVAKGASTEHFVPFTNVVVFAPGEVRQFVAVTLVDDSLPGAPFERVSLSLENPSPGAYLGQPASSSLVIYDDEGVVIGFEVTKTSFPEANGTVGVELIRLGAWGDELTVLATAEADQFPYHLSHLSGPVSQEVVFPPGIKRATFQVPVSRDYRSAGDERISLRLEARTPGVAVEPERATLTLLDRDSKLWLEGPISADENAGVIEFKLLRGGAQSLAESVEVMVENGTAVEGVDFRLPARRVTFPVGSRELLIPIEMIDDDWAQGARSFTLRLANPEYGRAQFDRARFTIRDDEVPVGPGSVTEAFSPSPFAGLLQQVRGLMPLDQGRLLFYGSFGQIGGLTGNPLRVLLEDGTDDPTFLRPSVSPAFPAVRSIVPLAGNRLLVMGQFQTFGGQPRTNAVVLERDGRVVSEVVLNFDFPPAEAYSLPGGGVLVTSDVASRLNGQPVPRVFRLTAEGQLDLRFVGGTNCTMRPGSILPLADGRIYADGEWKVSGKVVSLIRLFADGQPDPSFETSGIARLGYAAGMQLLPDGSLATGAKGRFFENGAFDSSYGDGTIRSLLALQADGRMIASENSQEGLRLVRLLADGRPDEAFAARFDQGVHQVLLDESGGLTAVGSFARVNDLPRARVVRLLGDDPTNGPRVRWHGRQWGVLRSAGVARIPVLREGNADAELRVGFRTLEGTAKAGLDFEPQVGEVRFGPGERLKLVEIPLVAGTGRGEVEMGVELSGAAVDLAGAIGRVLLLGETGVVEFESEGQVLVEGSRPVTVALRRQGGLTRRATVTLATSGTAIPWVVTNRPPFDLGTALPTSVEFAPGQSRAVFTVSPLDDGFLEPAKAVQISLTGASPGVQVGQASRHVITLVDDDALEDVGESWVNGSSLFPRFGGGYWSNERLWETNRWRSGRPVVRMADGRRDTSVPLSPLPSLNQQTIIAAYPDGRLLVGFAGTNVAQQVRVYRLTAGNEVDPTFPLQTLTYPEPNSSGLPLSFSGCTLPDGGAVVGLAVLRDAPGTLALFRLSAIGEPDPSFRGDLFRVSQSASGGPAWWVASQADGRVILGGAILARDPVFGESYSRRDLVRLRPEGVIDTTFTVFFGSPGEVKIRGLAVLPDDRLVIAGEFDAVNAVARPGLAVLQRDGEVDQKVIPVTRQWVSGATLSLIFPASDGGLWLSGAARTGGYCVERLTAEGNSYSPFLAPVFSGPLASLVPFPDGSLVVGGTFDRVNGELRSGLAWFDPAGGMLAEKPLIIRRLVAGPVTELEVETRTGVTAALEHSPDLRAWRSVGPVVLQPRTNRVEVPGTGLETGFLRLTW
ncbi:MAG: hypothetical protein J0M24_27530 [Verrucomicrobia bacterium]|nr:hypothetical protein [Verrucomicrobiota bacterium]